MVKTRQPLWGSMELLGSIFFFSIRMNVGPLLVASAYFFCEEKRLELM